MRIKKTAMTITATSAVLIIGAMTFFVVPAIASSNNNTKIIKMDTISEITNDSIDREQLWLSATEETIEKLENTDYEHEEIMLSAQIEEAIKPYQHFGVIYDKDSSMMIYDGLPVREIFDQLKGTLITRSIGTGFINGITPDRAIDLTAVYEGDNLIELKQSTQKEFDRRTQEREVQMVTFDNVDMRYYESGNPYIHWNWTNHTNQTITSCQFVMLGYDKDGKALDLHWNFLNSSKGSSFENLVNDNVKVSSGQTYDSDGGWSIPSDEAEQISYVIACIKKIELADGTTWENPEYDRWLENYKGKPVDVELLRAYYPH